VKINVLCTLGVACLSFVLGACSATGFTSKSRVIAPRTIRAPKDIDPEIVPYVPRFVEALERAGFRVGNTENKSALDLKFDFNGNPFNLRVSAGLWREGIPLLSASATNSGWGTALARGGAVNALADMTLTKFKRDLADLMTRTQIVPDAR